jgi:hypothetical protein
VNANSIAIAQLARSNRDRLAVVISPMRIARDFSATAVRLDTRRD